MHSLSPSARRALRCAQPILRGLVKLLDAVDDPALPAYPAQMDLLVAKWKLRRTRDKDKVLVAPVRAMTQSIMGGIWRPRWAATPDDAEVGKKKDEENGVWEVFPNRFATERRPRAAACPLWRSVWCPRKGRARFIDGLNRYKSRFEDPVNFEISRIASRGRGTFKRGELA